MRATFIFFIILSFHSNLSFGQKSEVIIDSADSKAVIFSKTLAWVTKTWKSADKVIQLKDEEAGTIIIKGGLTTVPKNLGIPAKGMSTTQLTIRVKDGKAKIEFEDTQFAWSLGEVWTPETKVSSGKKLHEKWSDEILKEIDSLILSYKEYVTTNPDDF